ncbi:MAG TPA: hypothetical protein VFC03_11770, partial [Acidimicrobiales bacterium]|nr:hypothetical protein [Acidimicrobiales bacterium]
ITDVNDANASTPIYLGGSDFNTSVTGNVLVGNGANQAAGISLNSNFYAPGTGVVISGNRISGFLYGISVHGDANDANNAAPTGYTISQNSVLHSTYGIRITKVGDLGPGSPSGTITGNMLSNITTDCVDATSGVLTAGTNNTWTGNGGTTNAPAGLGCGFLAPIITSASSAAAKVGVPFSFTVTSVGFGIPAVSIGSLPTGLSFTLHSDGTATISGIPGSTSAGKTSKAYAVKVTASNVQPVGKHLKKVSAKQVLTLTVSH